MITPTSVSSRLSARPVTPCPRSSISLTMTSARPSTRATPSPISRMTPTVCRVTPLLAAAISASMSASRLDMNAYLIPRSQPRLDRVETPAHGVVVDMAADPHAQSANQAGVLAECGVHAAPEPSFDIGLEARPQFGRYRNGAFHVGRVTVEVDPDQPLEAREHRRHAAAARLDDAPHHAADARLVEPSVDEAQAIQPPCGTRP